MRKNFAWRLLVYCCTVSKNANALLCPIRSPKVEEHNLHITRDLCVSVASLSNVDWSTKKPWKNPFPHPFSHFFAPWSPFHIFQLVR